MTYHRLDALFLFHPEKSQKPERHHFIVFKLHVVTAKSTARGLEIFELPSPGGAVGWTPLHPESSVHELLLVLPSGR